MTEAVVIGGGPVGLATAMLLADSGVETTVLERDPAGLPTDAESAWEGWARRSVSQFRQAHYLQPLGFQLLCDHLPSVVDELRAAGAVHQSHLDTFGSMVPGLRREPGDERFDTITTARRPVIELAFARAAANAPNVVVRRGAVVDGLLTGTSAIEGVPHIRGVHLDTGETLTADLVVDASGRRSAVPRLLTDIGAREPETVTVEAGFTYNSRYYRGEHPEYRSEMLTNLGSVSILTMVGDHDTWAVTLYHAPDDKALRSVRRAEVFERVVQAHPLHAHWVEGEPITDVDSMVSTANAHREYVLDGRPVATGLVPIGDAWGYTNPSIGRGITMGLVHAVDTVSAMLPTLDDPAATHAAWQEATAGRPLAFHDATVGYDLERTPVVEAERLGQPAPEPTDPAAQISAALDSARHYDPDCFRSWAEIATLQADPLEVLGRPGVIDRVLEVALGNEPYQAPHPTRAELEALVA